MRKLWTLLALFLAVTIVLPVAAQAPSPSDLNAIYKIEEEGFRNSQVMDIMSNLTDVYGPRLTNSPNIKEAAKWTEGKLNEWGVSNVHLEAWPFGRGWSNERFSAQMIAPRPFELIAYPKAWTPGLNGTVTADAVLVSIQTEDDLAKAESEMKGQLKGKFVLTAEPEELKPHYEADAHRYTDAELAEITEQPIPGARDADRFARFRALRELQNKVQKFLLDEGAAAWLEPSSRDDGTVTVQSGGSRDPKDPPSIPRIALAAEHYGRLYRLLKKKIPVTLQIDDENKFYDDDLNSFNIIGEIPGTDKANEVVMFGAHFDSWAPGTGATDNGAGSGVMLEAMRILKASGLKMHRTVRIGLWTGEEEGLLGSRAYVKEHFGDPATMQLKPDQAKLDAYYNVDNGTGKIRGVYLQGNAAVAPIFEEWMKPFHGLGMNTLTIRDTGGTDHLSFNAVGIPGFQFIQDPIDYDTRTHHTNMDLYERIQEPDMKQMAVIVASFAYLTANREEMMPRKPLPKPEPPRNF
ncbi:MAG TPA: M20/M25/M40 family metallo-hydrolase [Candidatus Limnocylindrales bacterium]|nr:M20/M25/M40 family metallo-hydrolase [Candidatus Limnocylindrales bacterium]